MIRIGIAVLAVAALLTGCARPGTAPGSAGARPRDPSASAGGTPSATVPACPPEGVRLESGDGEAAMGLRVVRIDLVNCGSETYRLNGYPAVRPLGEDRKELEVQVLHGVEEILGTMPWDGPPKPVVLEPGQRASAAVAWRNKYDDVREPPVVVAFLDIAPVAGRPSQIISPRDGLDLGSTGRFGISAWAPLPDGEKDSGTSPAPAGPPSAETVVPRV